MRARRSSISMPLNRSHRPHAMLMATLVLGISGACDLDGSGSDLASSATSGHSIGSPNVSDTVLATVDGKPISASSVDAPLRLELHDLEFAKYRARRNRLDFLIRNRLGHEVVDTSPQWQKRVEIKLSAPSPPRLEIPDSPNPIRGIATAPVTIVEFLDFESPHSRQLQPDLIRILDRYSDRVQLQVRDLPLPYHRYARQAAAAAHCAGEQGNYWHYHDTLLLEQSNLTPSNYPAYAARLGLDSDLLESCLASNRHEDRINHDLALASRLGVRRAATIFVNGLYLSGHPSSDEIERVLRDELLRKGLNANPRKTPGGSSAGAITKPLTEQQVAAQNARRADLPKIPADQLGEAEVVVTLTRAEVDYAIKDRAGLDRKLEASRAEFSGQRLLTIRASTEGDFIARLGLENGDVLMIVNGEFLTVDHNWIWDAFATKDKIVLLAMRRGLPHTFEYQIR